METSRTTCHESNIFTHDRQLSYLATGAKGRVHYCFNENGDVMAVKLLSLTGSRESIDNTKEKADSEVEILKTMNTSKYIVHYYDTVRFISESWIGILMEYMQWGTLYDFLQEYSFPNAPLDLRLRILYDVASGLKELHNATFDRRIAHNDLKPQNVLLDNTLRAKICDFCGSDFASHTSASIQEVRLSSQTHTDHYAAPEFLLNPGIRRTRAMDVFSFGMVIYYALTNKHPFERCKPSQIESCYRNNPDTRPEIIEDALPYAVEDDQGGKTFNKLKNVMKSCLLTNPDQRPDMKAVRKELQISFDETENNSTEFVFNWLKQKPARSITKDSSCITLEEMCHRIDTFNAGYRTDGSPIPEVQSTVIANALRRKETDEDIKEGDEIEIETSKWLYRGVVQKKESMDI